jgi:phosphoglycerol transferase MdoB-like AlkP superfamily enzyme
MILHINNVFGFTKRIFVPFFAFSLITRLILAIYASFNDQIYINSQSLVKLFTCGLINDLVTFIYFAAPLNLILLLIPKIIRNSKVGHTIAYIFYFCWIFTLCFNSVSEYIFWEEFGSRYNFIAVDYLVYTQEVIGNIYESYPLVKILASIFVVSMLIFSSMYPYYKKLVSQTLDNRDHLVQAIISNIILLILFIGYQEVNFFTSDNRYENELSKNGIYNLFSAFRNNSLSYEQFYLSLPTEQAFKEVRRLIKSPKDHYVDDNLYSLARKVEYPGVPHDYNVVLITVESLSAEFLWQFGDLKNLTPHINDIAKDSLNFTNYFATGTRTVRGLEASMLSIPPTAGNSIVRRPNNDNLFSLGSVLKDHGYQRKFIYGGYGYFDNMNQFFAGNGFEIIDRGTVSKEDISFSNIWGICDEDLFKQTIKEADKSYANKSKFFSLVLTTSNHRPYTYPDNKIDIASGTNRAGAVKYTDYAIGKFISEARTKPWFDNTIFIVTADHCASSAGKTEIPVEKYHIPLIIYAPKIIRPQAIEHLASQIDLAPTILGLLNISYVSKFFGDDILTSPKNRAFLGTYQQLAMLKNNKLVILAPQKKSSYFLVDENHNLKSTLEDYELAKEAISYYQTADYLFTHGLLKSN